MTSNEPLLLPGASCWKLVSASRFALIQDAAATFSAMASALAAAERSIFVVGWDLDTRTVMRHQAPGVPETRLLPLLCHCLDRRPELHVFVLLWDFSVIYAWEREPSPDARWGRAHPRLHFAMDDGHPMGGSHHQKVVVVDDETAFVGGIDLTLHRWDTPEHRPFDGRRRDGNGVHYRPFHDVHAAVAGPAARALGELVRTRWNARPRRPVPPLAPPPSALRTWPDELIPDATDLEVGLCRTDSCPGHAPVKEIESLTLTAIAAARRWIYVENQYLTAASVCRALAQQLARAHGPEVLLLLPEAESGWLEQSSMGILRAQAFQSLLRRDVHGRLRLLTPTVFDDGQNCSISVHSKVLVVDDRLAKIGSANLSSRSMGLDSECDLAVEAVDANGAAVVASVRNRLLGEHLGLSERVVRESLRAHGSLCRLVDEHGTQGRRRLLSTPRTSHPPFDLAVLGGAVVDPPEPLSASLILESAVPLPLRRGLARRWARPLLIVTAAIIAGLLVRHWTDGTARLRSMVDTAITAMAERPAGTLVLVLFYALAGSLFVPVTLLATATLATFGLWPGVAIAWLGSLLSATLSHAAGKRLGPRVVGWLPSRVERSVRRFLARQSFWAVVFMRLVPLGNFGALNLAAGALNLPRRSFVLGNMVGLLPGLLGLGVLVGRVLALLRRPSTSNVIAFAGVVVAVVGLTFWLRRRYRPERRKASPAPLSSTPPLVSTAPLTSAARPTSRD